jgi:hypothetical protein
MSHCRTPISRTCSFVTIEMLKSVNTDLSRHTALTGQHSCRSCRQYIKPPLTGHLSCRSCRQYIKPTLTGHLSCRSCKQYIKPTLPAPVDSLFYCHSVQSANSLPSTYCLNIYFFTSNFWTNKEGNLFQQSVKRAPLIVTFALMALKPMFCCIIL